MKKFGQYTTLIVIFIFCVAVIAVYKTFDNFSSITKGIGLVVSALRPFIIGFIIAYVLNLPCKKLGNLVAKIKNPFIQRHSFGIGLLIVYILAACGIVIVISSIVPAFYNNVLEFYTNLPTYAKQADEFLNSLDLVKRIGIYENGQFNILELIYSQFDKIDWTQFGKYAQGVITITSNVVSVFIAIIISIYMLLDKDVIAAALRRTMGIFMKQETVDGITHQMSRANNIFNSYIYSRLICSVTMAVICFIVLSIMKVKYALVLGLFIGACDMIPYFGSIIGSVVAVIVNFFTGGVWQSVWLAVVLLVLQQIDGNVLAPKIMSKSLEVRPLLIIFAVVVGGSLFGFMGMLLSVPVLTVVKAIITDFMDNKEQQKLARQTVQADTASQKEDKKPEE